MAAFAKVNFRVKRMAHNGFDACRYSSQPYEFEIDEDLKPIQFERGEKSGFNRQSYTPTITRYTIPDKDPIVKFLAHFLWKYPDLQNKQKYRLVYHDVSSGDNLLLETNSDLQVVINMNKEHIMAGKFILLHILENSLKKPTDIFSCVSACDINQLSSCRKCYDLTWSLYQCSRSADYVNLCGACITLGKHSTEHSDVVARDDHSEQVGNETANSQIGLPSQEKKKDGPQLLKFIEAKIKEQVGAEIRRLSGIMEETAESQAEEVKPDDGSTVKKRRRSRKKKVIEPNNQNEAQEKSTSISSSSKPNVDNLQGASSAVQPEEIPTMDVHSLIEQTRRSLSTLLAHLPDDLALSSKKNVAIKDQSTTMDPKISKRQPYPGIIEGTEDFSSDSISVVEDETKSLLDTSFIIVGKEKSVPRRHPDVLIDAALEKMLAMGFKDEGGWLTRLLEVKGGDIVKVLNVLHLS